MTGPDYAWLLIGWYSDKWWTADDDFIDCTVEEMTEAVLSTMYISTEPLQISPKTDPVVSGIVSKLLNLSLVNKTLYELKKTPAYVSINHCWVQPLRVSQDCTVISGENGQF